MKARLATGRRVRRCNGMRWFGTRLAEGQKREKPSGFENQSTSTARCELSRRSPQVLIPELEKPEDFRPRCSRQSFTAPPPSRSPPGPAGNSTPRRYASVPQGSGKPLSSYRRSHTGRVPPAPAQTLPGQAPRAGAGRRPHPGCARSCKGGCKRFLRKEYPGVPDSAV